MTVHQLALRFHQRLLPEPKLLFGISGLIAVYTQKESTIVSLDPRASQRKPCAIVLPEYLFNGAIGETIKKQLSCRMTSASSKDEARSSKVQNMREQHYDVFLTTMILERGVTFERISVVVLGADHPVFSKSSLVQIAGRADRKGGFTNSQVYFSMKKRHVLSQRRVKKSNK
ncbi:helicase-related protein [Enterococcus mundtii]|nr:helicase-related protein [Enterococcus mundtii]